MNPVFTFTQTSGGLLIAVDAAKAGALLEKMLRENIAAAAIGEVVAEAKGRISVR